MRKDYKRVAYFLIDTVNSLPATTDKLKLKGLVCDGFANRDMDSVAHTIASYMPDEDHKKFLDTYYKMTSKGNELSPEVEAALIGAVATIGTSAFGYFAKVQILKQCQRNMAFETGGGVWSTTSSQKIASMLHDMLK